MKPKEIEDLLKDHENRLKKLEQREKPRDENRDQRNSSESIITHIMELKTDGFFKTPKFLPEIIAELARRGHHNNLTSMSKPLLEAVRRKKLDRIGTTRKWKYVSR